MPAASAASASESHGDAASDAVSSSGAPSVADDTAAMPTSSVRAALGVEASVTTSAVALPPLAPPTLPHTGLSRLGPPALAQTMRTPPAGSECCWSAITKALGSGVSVDVGVAMGVAGAADALATDDALPRAELVTDTDTDADSADADAEPLGDELALTLLSAVIVALGEADDAPDAVSWVLADGVNAGVKLALAGIVTLVLSDGVSLAALLGDTDGDADGAGGDGVLLDKMLAEAVTAVVTLALGEDDMLAEAEV